MPHLFLLLLSHTVVAVRIPDNPIGPYTMRRVGHMTAGELADVLITFNEELFRPENYNLTDSAKLASLDRSLIRDEIQRLVGPSSSGDHWWGDIFSRTPASIPYPLHNVTYLSSRIYPSLPDPSESRDLNIAGDILISINLTRDLPYWDIWPNSHRIPFLIRTRSACIRSVFLEAASRWAEATAGCVQFAEVSETEYLRTPVLVVSGVSASGCLASLGYQSSTLSDNVINIGAGCVNVGTVMHLIGHVLGLPHENSRPDSPVKTVTANLNPEALTQTHSADPSGSDKFRLLFQPMRTNGTVWEQEVIKTPYEFASIMHTNQDYYGTDGRVTVTSAGGVDNDLMGNRGFITDRDGNLVNRMYKCDRLAKPVVDRIFRTPATPGVSYEDLSKCMEDDGKKYVEYFGK
jgi:hypothetical protein